MNNEFERFEKFSSSVSVIYRYIQKLEAEEMEKYGLKGSFAQYLIAIEHFPNGITAAALSELCLKDKAAISRAVNEMEQKGLILRNSGKDNYYRVPFTLTEKGKEAASFVRRRAEAAVKVAGEGLSDSSRAELYSALELIASNIQKITKEGIPENE